MEVVVREGWLSELELVGDVLVISTDVGNGTVLSAVVDGSSDILAAVVVKILVSVLGVAVDGMLVPVPVLDGSLIFMVGDNTVVLAPCATVDCTLSPPTDDVMCPVVGPDSVMVVGGP